MYKKCLQFLIVKLESWGGGTMVYQTKKYRANSHRVNFSPTEHLEREVKLHLVSNTGVFIVTSREQCEKGGRRGKSQTYKYGDTNVKPNGNSIAIVLNLLVKKNSKSFEIQNSFFQESKKH